MPAARRLVLLVLPAALLCRAAAAAPASLTVAVTLAPQAYIAKRLAPAGSVVVTMIPPGSSEETFEPSPSQIAALERTQIYFRVGHDGLPFETRYVTPLLAAHPEVRVVTLADGVELAPIAGGGEGVEARRDATDPHLWMSPAIMLRGAERLAGVLQELAPADRDAIAERLAALRRDVDAVQGRLRAAAAISPGAAFVAYHPNFGYLARDFGLRQIGVEAEGKELGLASLVRLTLDARAAGARILFVPPGPTEKAGHVLAESIGARVVGVDALGEPWLETLQAIADALGQTASASPEAPAR